MDDYIAMTCIGPPMCKVMFGLQMFMFFGGQQLSTVCLCGGHNHVYAYSKWNRIECIWVIYFYIM